MENKLLKTIYCLLLTGLLLISSNVNAYAVLFSPTTLKDRFNNSELIEFFNTLGENVQCYQVPSSKTLEVRTDDTVVLTLKYGNDYLEYDNRDSELTRETAEASVFPAVFLGIFMEELFDMAGFKNKTLSEPVNDFDKYGFQIEGESFEYKETFDGGSYSFSGYFIKYLKISLDSTMITALMNEYGVDIEDNEQDKLLEYLVPKLVAQDVTENSVTLYASVGDTNSGLDKDVMCFIYRADSIDGEYKKISEAAVNCSWPVGLVDEGLQSNTTYYYKAMVMGGQLFSAPIAVTTKGIIVNQEIVNQEIENPKTGVSSPILVVSGIIGLCSLILVVTRKKNILRKI